MLRLILRRVVCQYPLYTVIDRFFPFLRTHIFINCFGACPFPDDLFGCAIHKDDEQDSFNIVIIADLGRRKSYAITVSPWPACCPCCCSCGLYFCFCLDMQVDLKIRIFALRIPFLLHFIIDCIQDPFPVQISNLEVISILAESISGKAGKINLLVIIIANLNRRTATKYDDQSR